jgi:polyvinyl alcohol dehydrogenase (cytochrome)
LVTLSNGKTLLVAQQKSGVVWAIDPDKNGQIVWSKKMGRGGPVQFGQAVADQVGYFGAPDGTITDEFGGLWRFSSQRVCS